MIAPVLKSPGSKWRIAPQIVDLLPPHRVYLEPFAGSLAVLFSKPPSSVETVNDIDGEITNLFRVLRNHDTRQRLVEAVEFTPWAEEELFETCKPVEDLDVVERARRLVVRSHMNMGSRLIGVPHFAYAKAASGGSSAKTWATLPSRIRVAGERLSGVQVLRRDALEVIEAHASPEVCIYADPPYPHSTRPGAGKLYRHEMDDEDHEELLVALVEHPGPVLLSGYQSELYDEALSGWRRIELPGRGQSNVRKKEVVYLNPAAATDSPVLF